MFYFHQNIILVLNKCVPETPCQMRLQGLAIPDMAVTMRFIVLIVFWEQSRASINSWHGFQKVSSTLNKLQRVINPSVDPCENFYQYACDGVIEGREGSIAEETIKQVRKFSIRIQNWQNEKAPKMFKEFDNYYRQCRNTLFQTECILNTMKLFEMPLGLAVMEEYDLLNISQSILNSTLLTMKEMVNESDWLMDYSKNIAYGLFDSITTQVGLPSDFSTWQVYKKIDDFCSNTSQTNDACPKVIPSKNYGFYFNGFLDGSARVGFDLDSLFEAINKKKPDRFVEMILGCDSSVFIQTFKQRFI